MPFTTDKQTLDDLNIFGRHGGDSIYAIFNRCFTRGGASILEEMFRYPLSDDSIINKRSGIIRFFAASNIKFPFEPSLFDAIEPYIANTDERTKLDNHQKSVVKKIGNMIAVDTDAALIYKGVNAVVQLINGAAEFIKNSDTGAASVYANEKEAISGIVFSDSLESLLQSKGKLSHTQIAELDVLIRFRNREDIQKLLRHIYYLDVYICVARVAKSKNFIFAEALPAGQHIVELEEVYHPQVKNAIANNITISPDGNVIFLTGANMAGKSTFMKSLSISLFLAHMGFPVPAKSMKFSVLDGIYTTINLPDNLGMGASHFYAEVLRVKKIANELQQGKNLFIVFDELFRGTNVKDAYEATIEITKGFATKHNSLFIISTHIIEAGEILKNACANIRFLFLPTRMNGNHPVYTYKLEEGITDDRHGMVIVKNEGILELLEKGSQHKTDTGNKFIADKQTIEDLNLLGKFKPNSIYSLFNKVKTSGGEKLLEQMFHHPLTNETDINQRGELFRYFEQLKLSFPFSRKSFLLVENYLGGAGSNNRLSATATLLRHKITAGFLKDENYGQLQAGLIATIDMLNKLSILLNQMDIDLVKKAKAILSDKRLSRIKPDIVHGELPLMETARYDFLLRHTMRNETAVLLECIYQLDVYIAVSNVARERKLSYAHALPASNNCISTSALWHPGIEHAVANPVSGNSSNLLFLTGANMAGKSTFMKSFGIAVYLAHMGFPVAARDMEFSVRDGLYSSINVADNLNMGYSHFYAEVLRVKTVAQQVSSGKNLVVIFDELFKGTNVKDAYDATLYVTASFARYQNCFFIVSTHIIEVAEALNTSEIPVQFLYLPTIMEGAIPKYTYQLTEGVTSDRHGMVIITNEKILDILTTTSQKINYLT